MVKLRGILIKLEKKRVSDPLAIKLGDITMVSPGELLKMASRREPGPESARVLITVGWAEATNHPNPKRAPKCLRFPIQSILAVGVKIREFMEDLPRVIGYGD
jgi:hypothetical protein